MNERIMPAPTVTPENSAFFDAAAQGRYLVKRCDDCNAYHYYPRAMCPHCGSFATQWKESSGRGHIYTVTVMRSAQIPYAVGYVTLEDEGVRVLTNFVDADLNTLKIGQPVKVAFRKSEGDVVVPVFAPA